MMIRIDPENSESRALFDLVDFRDNHVLEIGCGDGRLTWRYADKAAYITAIDPSAEQIALAKENRPSRLQDRIEFHVAKLEDFAANSGPAVFDLVILSYSLC